MNRKTFLKSLLVIPAITLFGKKIFARDEGETIEHNPYKLRFVDSKNKKIDKIILLNKSKYLQVFFDGECEKIRSLVGDDFYCMDYISVGDGISICNRTKWVNENRDEIKLAMAGYRSKWLDENRDKIKLAIVGHELDWWSPIKFAENKKEYVIDTDSIKDKSTHLTKEDQKTIRSYLNYKR